MTKTILLALAALAGDHLFGQVGVIPIPDPPTIKSPYLASKVVKAVRNRYSSFIALQSHRGHWETWPENTKWAYYDAMRKGIELLEVDLRRCSGLDANGDPCIAVQHDKNLGRVTTTSNNVVAQNITAADYKALWMKDRAGRAMAIRPLLFRELLQFVKDTQEDGKSIVLIIDCKEGSGAGYSAYDLLKEASTVANNFWASSGGAFNREALIWKLWLAKVPTNPYTLSSDLGWDQNTHVPWQNLILTVWPPNYSTATGSVGGSQCGSTTPQVPCVTQFGAYLGKPYLAQFELISSYLNDPLATWVQYLGPDYANAALGDYWHDDVLPEGISGSDGACCLFAYTRSEFYATSPYTALAGTGNTADGFGNNNEGCWDYRPAGMNRGICLDQRGFLDRVLQRQPTSIVSDKAADLIPYLTNIGKRNWSVIP